MRWKAKAEKLAKGKHIAARPSRVQRTSVALKAAVAVCIAVLIAWAAGLGLASAGGSALNALPENDQETEQPTTEVTVDLARTSELGVVAQRDVSAGVAEIAAEEEAARIAAEQAAREHEAQCIEQAKAAQAKSAANGGMGVYAVDFTIGRDAFLAEWTDRINDYLSGSPLAGYGSTFAEAAWEYGVDPRWSPAISNTESTKGRNCFAWHNAWGWTGGSWSSWNNAIWAHVKGLSEIYGFTHSFSNAQRYCPPNYANWYRDTLNEMAKI